MLLSRFNSTSTRLLCLPRYIGRGPLIECLHMTSVRHVDVPKQLINIFVDTNPAEVERLCYVNPFFSSNKFV